MKDYLFAYGTLAQEKAPKEIATVIKRLRPIGNGFVPGKLYDLGDYPGAILSNDPNEKVFGKVFELPMDRKVLDRLDAYEGFNAADPDKSLFVRKRARIRRPNRQAVTGWIYEFNGDVTTMPMITSGCYSAMSV